jgi:cystathionine gamma-synthase
MGAALPTDEHACSVSLPTWASVVGYEEGDPNVTRALSTGYPRFVYHRYVVQLMDGIVKRYGNVATEDCLVLPTRAAAERCRAFLQQAVTMSAEHQSPNLHLQQYSDYRDNAYIGSYDDKDNNDDPSCTNQPPSLRIVELPHVSAVIFPAQTKYAVSAKAYWQHTGEIVSSRRAEMALTLDLRIDIDQYVTACRSTKHSALILVGNGASTSGCSSSSSGTAGATDDEKDGDDDTASTASTTSSSSSLSTMEDYDLLLRRRIADWTGCEKVDEQHVFLAPSGMGAIYTALRASRRYRFSRNEEQQQQQQQQQRGGAGGGTSIVFGFPYLDTLKLCSRTELCPDGVEFFGHGNAQDLQQLQQLLEKSGKPQNQQHRRSKHYCALFTEVPSNPLLHTPDLWTLRKLADEYDFCLIVDDTISNFLNVDVLSTGLADAVCTSLTKLVSGRGDAIAGSIVTNPYTERGRYLQNDLSRHHDASALYRADARAIYHNSNDFVERNAIINDTAGRFAAWLVQSHPDLVAQVYYPQDSTNYASVMRTNRPGVGYGGLMSIVLHPHVSCQRAFFDALDVPKGPSLGTNFTLVCPYTLLAHYHELDFAMSYNVQPNLLRIAVGLEPLEELCEKFDVAFRASRLYK